MTKNKYFIAPTGFIFHVRGPDKNKPAKLTSVAYKNEEEKEYWEDVGRIMVCRKRGSIITYRVGTQNLNPEWTLLGTARFFEGKWVWTIESQVRAGELHPLVKLDLDLASEFIDRLFAGWDLNAPLSDGSIYSI